MYREKELTDAEFERDLHRWSDESNRCYIATTPPMRERACRQQLREHGMTVFLPECIDLSERVTPRMRHGNRRLDRIKRRRTPIYPGYLFLRSTDAEINAHWPGDRTEATLKCRDDGTGIPLTRKTINHLLWLQKIEERWEGPIGVRLQYDKDLDRQAYRILENVPGKDEWEHIFEIGQQVRLGDASVFQGFSAVVLEETRDEVTVEISLLGRATPTTVAKTIVAAA